MAKNTHLEHLEDDIVNSGKTGGFNAINFLRELGKMLTQPSGGGLTITTKWDGAPAVVCGRDPVTGMFFVGTKSVFNKTAPKLGFNHEMIDYHYPNSGLNKLLKICFDHLINIGITGVLQGDLPRAGRDAGAVGGARLAAADDLLAGDDHAPRADAARGRDRGHAARAAPDAHVVQRLRSDGHVERRALERHGRGAALLGRRLHRVRRAVRVVLAVRRGGPVVRHNQRLPDLPAQAWGLGEHLARRDPVPVLQREWRDGAS